MTLALSRQESEVFPDALAVLALHRVGRIWASRWRLDAVLGMGASAAVYSATHRNGDRVAIKVLHPEYAFHEELRCRLNREAHVANLVSHPGASRVLEHDMTENGEIFVVMELVEGETLASYMKRHRGGVDSRLALRITLLVLDVLAAAHEKGIAHRDIKLENVMITRRGEVKVLDFGIARMQDGFLTPERGQGKLDEIDAQSDVWSVGAILFQLLTGIPPRLPRGTPSEGAALEPAPRLEASFELASPELIEFVDRALAFDKKDRWRSAGQMRDALLRILGRTTRYRQRITTSFAPPPAEPMRAVCNEQPGEELNCVWRAEPVPTLRVPSKTVWGWALLPLVSGCRRFLELPWRKGQMVALGCLAAVTQLWRSAAGHLRPKGHRGAR
jgi:serine/threonine-protein kinase